MESSRNENIQGPDVEQIEDGNQILQGNQQELIDDNVPEIQEEVSPDSTLIMSPASSSPIIPETPSTSDEDFVNIQEVSRTPSPSLLEDYGDVNAIPLGPVDMRYPSPSPTVPIAEERSRVVWG